MAPDGGTIQRDARVAMLQQCSQNVLNIEERLANLRESIASSCTAEEHTGQLMQEIAVLDAFVAAFATEIVQDRRFAGKAERARVSSDATQQSQVEDSDEAELQLASAELHAMEHECLRLVAAARMPTPREHHETPSVNNAHLRAVREATEARLAMQVKEEQLRLLASGGKLGSGGGEVSCMDDLSLSECVTPVTSFVIDLAASRANGATTGTAQEASARIAEAEAQWLAAFWFGTQQRKHGVQFEIEARHAVRVTGVATEGAPTFEAHWTRQLLSALKKCESEDIGAMDASSLWEAIPEEDGAGRGRRDLAAMERELSVKAAFCEDGHVVLVGAKAKLQKKAFAMRNLLSHYHWRLSGRDVAFEVMAQRR